MGVSHTGSKVCRSTLQRRAGLLLGPEAGSAWLKFKGGLGAAQEEAGERDGPVYSAEVLFFYFHLKHFLKLFIYFCETE